jgi:hypothetical protein
LDDVVIKNGEPICRRCSTVLVFGEVKPRRMEKAKRKKRKKRKRKSRKTK